MKVLNIRLLGAFAIGLLVLGGGSYVLHGYQMQRHAGAYLREARRAQDENRPREAVRHFRRYVKLAPHDTEGLALYGLQLAELNQLQPAYLVLDQALRRQPGREDWRRQLVETALDLERYNDARANLEEHLLKRHPQDATLLVQLGRCHVALGEDQSAAKAFEAAIAAAPQTLEPYILLAGLHKTRFKDAVEADRWINRMVDANAADHRAYLVRGEWKLGDSERRGLPDNRGSSADPAATGETPDLAAVEEDARRALELAPEGADALLFAARVAATGRRHDEARALAVRSLESRPNTPGPYALLAEIEAAAGDRAAVVEWLRRGVEAVPLDPELRWNYARLLVESKRDTEARAEIERLRQQGHPPARLDYLEAQIAFAAGNWREAIHSLKEARPGLAPWPELTTQADYCLGKCYEQLGNPDRQLIALRRAVSTDPDFVPARLGLAEALLATGRAQEAQEHYRFVSSLPSAPTVAGLRLTQLLVVENLRRDPSQRDWKTVTRNLDLLEQSTPDSPQVKLLRAEILVAQERHAEAERLLEAARQRDPDQLEILAAEVALAEQSGNEARADELLEAGKETITDKAALSALMGRTLVRRQGNKAAASLRNLWRESETTMSAGDRARLAESLAGLAVMAEDLALAAETGAIAAAASPDDLRIRELLLDVAVRDNKPERMDEILADVHRIEGAGALWHYGQALKSYTIAQGAAKNDSAGRWATALDEIDAARTLRPGWSKPVLLAAEIFDRQGNSSRAADAYLEAISLGERHPPAVARAVTLLLEQKRFVDADQVVRRIQEQQGLFTGNLARLAAETSLRLEEFDRASNLTRSFAVDSDRYEDHLWAGQMLDLLGRYDEAETRLRRAIEIDPQARESRIALIRVLAHAGRIDDAEAAIAEAEAAVDANAAAVTAAQGYEILGRTSAAEERFRSALQQSPDDAYVVRRVTEFFLKNRNAAEAEPHLRRFVSGDLRASDDDRTWARRSLAIVLGTRGGRRGLSEALALLDANQTPGHASSADIRARAIILASHPSSKSRQQAIDSLGQLLADERTASPEDRFLLAELLRRDGNVAGAADELRKALAAQPDQPRYISAYVELLLERGETSEAELWVERLTSLAPSDRLTVDLDARVLFAANRFDQVAAVLKEFASATENDPDPAARRLWAAEQLADFAARLHESSRSAEAATLAQEATSLFERHLVERPDDALVLAKFQARMGQIEQAIGALTAPPDSAQPAAIEAVAVAVMTNPSVTADQLTQLQRLLDKSVERSNAAAPLLVVSADLLGWRGDLMAAEARYRQVLEQNGDDVRVLNNLALVLALGQKRYDEALTCIQRAIEIAGPHGALLDTRGLVQLAAGRSKQAQADFQLAIDQESAAERYLHLAAAQWQSREQERAQQTLRQAEKLGLVWTGLHPLERPLLAELQSQFQVSN